MSLRHLAAAGAFAMVSLGASAQTITFDEFSTTDLSWPGTGYSFTTQGFDFSNSQGGDFALGVWGTSSPYQADPSPTGASIFVNYADTTTTVVRHGGGSFDFYSIDLADVYNTGVPVTIEFNFALTGGGSATQSVTLDSVPGLQSFVFNQTGVDSVSWTTTAGENHWNQFDNVATSPVPEPGTWAMLVAGLGLLGAAKRRRG